MDLTPRLPQLGDGSVRLRTWRFDDLGCIAGASAEGVIPRSTTVPVVYTEEEGRAFVERQWSRAARGEGWSFAITATADDRARGCVVLVLRPQPGVAGIGYWLAPGERGLGYASRAVGMLTDWALSAEGALHRVEAWVEPHNRASAGLLLRCGYRQEGMLRSFLAVPDGRADALVFSRIRSDVHR